jgi:RNA polymerase sigma-70 factor (ECF subfamily)
VDDQKLAAALAADVDGHFERLVTTYQDRLYAFALRLTGSLPDAEEIAQDAFVRAYQALRRYPADRLRTLSLRPWLYQIALNVFRNRVRGRQLQLVPLAQDGAGQELEPQDNRTPRPDVAVERAEFRDRLSARVQALPERYRVAVVLRHVQGLGYGEIATILKQPIGTVKANVHRGLRLLREALDEGDC